ncbi:Serine/threonine protein kinase, partial [Spiromyces aspiralis]
MAGHSIDGGNIQFVRQIGVGTYGDVYLAIDRRSQKKYAVKILPRPKKPSSADNASPTGGNNSSPSSPLLDARELAPEIALYVQIPAHSNIVRLERVLHTHDQIFMLMEYCAGGDLYENISSPKDPSLRIQGNDALIRRL